METPRHANFKNIASQRFGRLVALDVADHRRSAYWWRCQCDCGKVCVKAGAKLCSGKTRSCGCLRVEATISRHVTHGQSKARAYGIWNGIKNRCRNPHVKAYPDYGGRGIKLCERWESFENFSQDMGQPPAGYCIERVNNDGNYEPSNCKWIPRSQQARNTRKNVFVTLFGVKKCLSEWARTMGMSPGTVERRVQRGWSAEDALTKELGYRPSLHHPHV